jgi:ankyrin repeat protein
MVDFMLTKNVDVNRPDVNGWTMMHVACARGHEKLVVLLIGLALFSLSLSSSPSLLFLFFFFPLIYRLK